MSEYADYALNETFDEEMRRADELPDGEPVSPYFSWGTPDAVSLEKEVPLLIAMVNGYAGQFSTCDLARYSSRKTLFHFALPNTKVAKLAKKLQVAAKMRLGMAKQVCLGKPLSEKQRAWLQTNWKGGATTFEKDVMETTDVVQNLERITNMLLALAAD